MVREISIHDIRQTVKEGCFCGDDFLFITPYPLEQTNYDLQPSGYVKLTDVMIVIVREGELEGMINHTPLHMKAGDVLVCTNAIFERLPTHSSNYKASVLIATRRLLIDSVPFANLISAAMFRFERDYTLLSLSEATRERLALYGDIFRERFKTMDTPNASEIIRLLTKCFLCELLDILVDGKAERPEPLGQSEKIVVRFFELLENTRPRPRFLSYYASELCVSPKHLSEVCKRVTGRTALQWITEYIVRDVRYYLLHTDLSIKEIVFHLDFPNSSFFGKYVNTHLGMKPKDFRTKLGSEVNLVETSSNAE